MNNQLKSTLRNNTAEVAWGVIGAGVLAYEYLAPENQLLSHAADRAIEKHPAITTAAIGIIALHLANLTPSKFDVISIAGERMRKFKRNQAAGETA